ncbi:MAG TPA: serine/threonine-protein kinase, partial [Ktedonobacteraceae bacterium]|nr:serine/threonine-protein kinase [Ktedonobacteraceae bacterium]
MVQDLTGQMVGHYYIIKSIEQGGMATVYRARDIHLQREVAIKVFQSQRDQKRTQELFYRFTREAQVVARLDHPNILLVHDYGEQDNLAYLVMPYLSSGSLKDLLRKRGRLPIPEALHLIFQLLDALQYAHDQGLIHRDIKPGNILFKNDQTPVLADFGLVKEIVTGNTEEMTAIDQFATDRQLPLSNGHIMGTPYYMAPE